MENNSNNLKGLNDQLFAALRNLNTEISGDALKEEVQRAKAITDIGKVIVDNHRLVLDAIQMVQDGKVYAAEVKVLIGN